jgi:methylmalonyl-CoA mutase cobalamin-binding subunit
VAGEHIPALNFFALLLGGERNLETHDDFYRMLLELDSTGARAIAIRYCDENGLERTFDDILAPALKLAGKEHAERHISDDNMAFILSFVGEFIQDLGIRFCASRAGSRSRVLGVCPPGEAHSFGLLMVLELSRCAGAAVKFSGEGKSVQETGELARLFSPDVVCLSCTLSECLPAAVELTDALKREFPRLTIIAGGVAALSYPAALLRAGCSQICASRSQTHRAIRQMVTGRRARAANPIAAPATNSVEDFQKH